MPRKTYAVSDLLARLNRMLTTPESSLYLKCPGKDREMTPAEAFRMGMISIVESVLHETDNYKGFGYQGDVMREVHDGPFQWEITDETRRVYYPSNL